MVVFVRDDGGGFFSTIGTGGGTMRLSKGILVWVVVAFLLGVSAVAFAAPPTGWPVNRGEICLNVWGENGVCATCQKLGTVSMYVSKMGDGHYLVVGRNTEYEDDAETVKEIVPFIGAAELVDMDGVTKVRIHITGSGAMPAENGDPGDAHGNMTTVILDPVSLIGTVETIDFMALKTTIDLEDDTLEDYQYGEDYDIKYAGLKELYPCNTTPPPPQE